jgi:hypothetical protein
MSRSPGAMMPASAQRGKTAQSSILGPLASAARAIAAAGRDPLSIAPVDRGAAAVYSGSMPPKRNPLNLNPLQLKTLTLLQALAALPGHAQPGDEPGSVVVAGLPDAHGDHFHLGDAVVAGRDATGLHNPSVWTVLERKGLIRSHFPEAAVLTALGRDYETGLRDAILHRGGH